MSQKERNEWIERAKQRVLNNAEITDQSVKEIMFLFDEAAWTLESWRGWKNGRNDSHKP